MLSIRDCWNAALVQINYIYEVLGAQPHRPLGSGTSRRILYIRECPVRCCILRCSFIGNATFGLSPNIRRSPSSLRHRCAIYNWINSFQKERLYINHIAKVCKQVPDERASIQRPPAMRKQGRDVGLLHDGICWCWTRVGCACRDKLPTQHPSSMLDNPLDPKMFYRVWATLEKKNT